VSEPDAERRPHLRLNPMVCDGAGYCAELVPELITLDDWGYPIVDRRPIDQVDALRHAARAVSGCPRVALALTFDVDRA
jgi:ferredoxin